MTVQKFAITDATFERSPGQSAEVYAGNVVDQRQGGPITIGYGRYGSGESIDEHIAVDDVMVVLKGQISVQSDAGTITAGPGEIIYMPKGSVVAIRSHDEGAETAYVTYPHWQEAKA
jgi:ethanolamine utilization protein EutQ (cupin superfamily)